MAQQTITFEEARFAAAVGITLRDNGPANTLDDSAVSGLRIVIARGAMFVEQTAMSGRHLFFSRFQPGSPSVDRQTGRIVLRFAVPQRVVNFRLSSDFIGANNAPVLVQFFATIAPPPGTQPVAQQAFNFGQLPTTVTFLNAAQPVLEVQISSRSAENTIDELVFSDIVPVATRDVVATLDGSGSMSQQGKWAAMIEASALFQDLYRTLGEPQDGFGAQLFRWDCPQQINGLQLSNLLPLAPLSAMADLPAALAAQAPMGCTPIGEAVVAAAAAAQAGANTTKAVLLLTDGINNKGRTVANASADPALAQTAVHCVGLGVPTQIDPVAIAALAAAHGGQFRATDDPSEVLDFFAQALAQILGKAEIAQVTGNVAQVAPGTTKAVFVAAWAPGGAAQSFNLLAPDGTTFLAAGPVAAGPVTTVSFQAGTAARSHAFFVVEGANLGGSWSFVNLPAATRRLVVEDLSLRIAWSVTPKLGVSGEPIRLSAAVTFDGMPYKGQVDFDVKVTRPDLSTGVLLAAGGTSHTGRLPPADANLRHVFAQRALKALNMKALPQKTETHQGFVATGPGEFEWEYPNTTLDGVYRFDLQARSAPGSEVVFHRRVSLFAVLVTAPKQASSDVRVSAVSSGIWHVAVRPALSKSRPCGPFLAPWLRLVPDAGRMSGVLEDHLDGRYSQLLITGASDGPKARKPKVRVELLVPGMPPAAVTKPPRKAAKSSPPRAAQKASTAAPRRAVKRKGAR